MTFDYSAAGAVLTPSPLYERQPTCPGDVPNDRRGIAGPDPRYRGQAAAFVDQLLVLGERFAEEIADRLLTLAFAEKVAHRRRGPESGGGGWGRPMAEHGQGGRTEPDLFSSDIKSGGLDDTAMRTEGSRDFFSYPPAGQTACDDPPPPIWSRRCPSRLASCA